MQTIRALVAISLFVGSSLVGTARATIYTVTTSADSGNGSLRAALTAANASSGFDEIHFAIPSNECAANGVCRISVVGSPLPPITDPLLLDGTTQPRFGTAPDNVCATPSAPSYMRIEVFYPSGGFDGAIEIETSDLPPTIVRGLSLDGATAIRVEGAGPHRIQCNHLGMDGPGLLSLNGGYAALIDGVADGTVIGTDGDGVDDFGERNAIAAIQYGIYVNSNTGIRIAGNSFCMKANRIASFIGSQGVFIRQGSNRSRIGTDWDGVSDDLEGNLFASCNTGIHYSTFSGENPAHVAAGNQFGLPNHGNQTAVQSDGPDGIVLSDNVFTNDNVIAVQLDGAASLMPGSERNCLDPNMVGVFFTGSGISTFENNWWGAADGPAGAGPGTGASVGGSGTGSVDYTPFATDGCHPVPEPAASLGALAAALALAVRARRRRG